MSTAWASPRDGVVIIEGRRLYVREWGPLDAPAVVILHGIIGNSHEWDTVAARLATARRVILPDQRGHGASDWADGYRADGFVADLAALVDALGLGVFDLVGHSLGGIVAILYAGGAGSRARSLAVLDIGPDSLTDAGVVDGVREMVGAAASAGYRDVDQAVAAWIAGNPRARPAETRRWAAQCLHRRPDGTWGWSFDAAGLGEFIDDAGGLPLWSALRRISIPTLLVRGADSALLTRETARRMLSVLAGGRFVEIQDAGHDLGVESPHDVAVHLAHFLGVP